MTLGKAVANALKASPIQIRPLSRIAGVAHITLLRVIETEECTPNVAGRVLTAMQSIQRQLGALSRDIIIAKGK